MDKHVQRGAERDDGGRSWEVWRFLAQVLSLVLTDNWLRNSPEPLTRMGLQTPYNFL